MKCYHLRVRNQTTLDDGHWLRSKPRWIPNHQIGQLAHLYTSNHVPHSLSNRWVDGVFADITLHPEIIRTSVLIFLQCAALHFILVCCIPCSENDLATTTHGLRIGRHHADRSQIMKDIFCSNGFGTNTGFGECDIFWNVFGQVMADHQHVKMLVQRIPSIRSRGVGG